MFGLTPKQFGGASRAGDLSASVLQRVDQVYPFPVSPLGLREKLRTIFIGRRGLVVTPPLKVKL
jgi:hypothetical protein